MRVRRVSWLVFGALYLGLAGLLFAANEVYERDRSEPLYVAALLGTLALWIGSGAHALTIRREFVRRVRDRRHPDAARREAMDATALADRRPGLAGAIGIAERQGTLRDASAAAMFPLLMVFFIGFGGYVTWESLSKLPRTYDALEERGAVTQAHVSYHDDSLTGDDYHLLTLQFRGVPISKRYRHNHAQLRSLSTEDTVPVMVDPQDTGTVFTITDVRERTNSGIGVAAPFGIGMALGGFAGLGWLIRFERRSGRELAELRVR